MYEEYRVRQQVFKVNFGGLLARFRRRRITDRELRPQNWAGNFEGRYFENFDCRATYSTGKPGGASPFLASTRSTAGAGTTILPGK